MKRLRAARAGLLVLGALTGALVPGCRRQTEASERRDKITTLVADPRHDFGHVTQGATLRHGFAMYNATAAPLTIDDASEVLGCSGVPVPRVLAPERDGKFDVTCRANVYGPLRVSLPLRANGHPAGELSLVGEVEPLLTFDRPLLEIDVPFGVEGRGEAHLRGKLARGARLTLATEMPSGIRVEVRLADDGAVVAELRVVNATVGTHAGTVVFRTGLEQPQEIALPYVVKVAGTLTVSPTNPVLDLGVSEKARTVITVKSTQAAFAVKHAEVLEGPFAAVVRRTGDAFEVEVSVLPEKFPRAARGANGRIRILSNDRTEPTKELPLFALGRPD